jgi:hypothetical protein
VRNEFIRVVHVGHLPACRAPEVMAPVGVVMIAESHEATVRHDDVAR